MLKEIFNFDKNVVTSYIMYELKLGGKFKEAFNYISSSLPNQRLKKLEKLKWDEGKNYDWAIIKKKEVTLIIRKYQTHFTIFFKNVNKEISWFNKYGCFTFHSDLEKMSDEDNDKYVESNFTDLDNSMEDLIKIISKDEIHTLWNEYCFPRPKHVVIKNIWNGADDLSSIDDFIFCCEELFNKYLELFAKTDMFEKIKSIRVGDKLNNKYEVLDVSTAVKDGYFHDIGLMLKGTNGVDDVSWKDVYSLTRWYLNDIFIPLQEK
jgi:hypothetical protein